jgi:hypothetical protein
MIKKQTALILVGVLALCCVCIPLFAMVVTLPPDNSLRQVTTALFWSAGCIGLPLFAVAGLVWTLVDNRRSRQVGRKLADELGLRALTPSDNPLQVWYGGEHNGRSFALKPVVFASRAYDGYRHRTGIRAHFYLRLVMAVNLPRPLAVTAERTHEDQNGATTFTEAFPRLENGEKLNGRSQQALLNFVQNGAPQPAPARPRRRPRRAAGPGRAAAGDGDPDPRSAEGNGRDAGPPPNLTRRPVRRRGRAGSGRRGRRIAYRR